MPPFVPQHTPQVILTECLLAGKTGIFIVSIHGCDREDDRTVDRKDIRHALTGITTVAFQPDKGTWLATGGVDREGESLGVAVVLTHGIVVVTVF